MKRNLRSSLRGLGAVMALVISSGMAYGQCSTLVSTFPYSEDFENPPNTLWGTSTTDSCWVTSPTNSGYHWGWDGSASTPSSGTGPLGAHSGSGYLFTEASSSGTSATVGMPAFDLTTLTSPQLTYYTHKFGTAVMGDLYVDASTDGGVTWTAVDSVLGTNVSAASDPWEYRVVDVSSYNTANTTFRFRGISNGTYEGDMCIDLVVVEEAPPCPLPTGFSVTNVTASGIDVTWGGTSTSGDVIYGATGFDPATGGNTYAATTDPATVTGLSQATAYDVYFVQDCGVNGTSDTVGPVAITTSCLVQSLPYSQDFTTWVPPCIDPTLGTANWLHNTGGYAYADFWSVNGGIYIMEFPDVDINANARLKFDWSSNQGTFYTDSMYVEGTTDNGATWNTLWVRGDAGLSTISGGSNTTLNAGSWVTEKINLDSTTYTGDTLKIRFRGISDWGPNVFIDNVIIEAQPACPEPVFDGVSNITGTTADISWIGPGSNFSLEVGPTGFTQGTGLTFTSTTNMATLSGLNGETTYDVYIQNDCTPANGFSIWEGPFTFTTYPTPDYMTDFASYYPTSDYQEAIGFMGDTLTYASSDWNSDGYLNNGFSGAITGYFRTSTFYIPSDDWYVTTPVDLGAGGSYEMHIDMGVTRSFQSGPGQFEADDTLRIGISTDGGITFSELASFHSGNQPNEIGATYTFNLTAYSGVVRFGFMIDNPIVNTNDPTFGYPQVHIDNFGVRTIPACPDPGVFTAINVTASTITVGWDTTGVGASAYYVEYNAPGTSQGTGVVDTTVADSLVITGLMPATTYQIWVQSDCGSSVGNWVGPITVTTACPVAFTAPYSTDFENITLGADPGSGWENCFSANTNTGYRWEAEVSPTFNSSSTGPYYDHTFFGATGGHYMFTEASLSGNPTWITSPSIDVSGLTQPAMYFWYHMYGQDMSDLDVEVNNGSGWVNVFSIQGEQQSAEIDPWLEAAIPLQSYIGDTIQVRFTGTRNGTFYGDLSIDDFSVGEAVPCMGVAGGIASNVTTSSADLSWSGYGSNFTVEWGAQGFNQGSGVGTVVTNANPPLTITGLTENTYYDFYVNDPCAPGTWYGPYTFKTPCSSALSGLYTVGGTPGATNFSTLDSAISRMIGCGISGPVTFNIMATSDTMEVVLPEIEGSSMTNTITLDGMGTFTLYAPGGAYGAVRLDGADHVSINNMTLVNMNGSNSHGIVAMNNSDYLTIDNNTLMVDTTSTTSTIAGFTATNSMTSPTTSGADIDNLTFTNNTVYGGYYGFAMNGDFSVNDSILNLSNNTFVNQYYYGIRVYGVDSIEVHGNSVSKPRSNFSYGAYLYYTDAANVTKNNLVGGNYGLYTYAFGNDAAWSSRSVLENNMAIGDGNSGLYASQLGRADIYHNSFKGGRGINVFGSTAATQADIRNNVFYGSTLAADFSFELDTVTATLNYNLYESEATNLVEYGSGFPAPAYTDLATWQAAHGALNMNSVEGDPVFAGPEDLHLVGALANDVADISTATADDIDGDVRPATGSTATDMGADEYTPLNYDLKLNGMIVPLAGCGDSIMDVSLIVENQGLLDATSYTMTVEVTGGIVATLNSGAGLSLLAGEVDTISVGSINTYNGPMGVDFEGFINYVSDQDNSNDTIIKMGGSYTPYEPQVYAGPSACLAGDSVTLAAMSIGGVQYSWWDDPMAGTQVGLGDSILVPASGPNTYYAKYETNADSLLTTTAGGNGSAGNMFDIVANSSVTITGFSQVVDMGGAAANVEVWYRVGTHVGFTGANTGWTQLGTASLTATTPAPGLTYYPIPVNITIPAGQTYSFYVTTNGGSVDYTNGTALGNVFASNPLFDVLEGSGGGYFSVTFSPRVFNGMVHFGSQGCSDIRTPVTFSVDSSQAVANFTWVEDLPANPGTIIFDASTSTDADTYLWDFGDGMVGSGMVVSHAYSGGGNTYQAILVVMDSTCGTTDTITMPVTTTVGIESSMLDRSLEVFPNPTDGRFRADFSLEGIQDVKIRVLNSLGQIMEERELGKISGSYRTDFDLSSQPRGVYILQIQTDDQVVNRRITLH